MNTIIETPKGYKKVERDVDGNKVISFEPIKETVVPENWEDFCRKRPEITGEYCIDNKSWLISCETSRTRLPKVDKNLFSTKQRAKAMLAFIQLIRVRDYVNRDWEGDWDDATITKYCIANNFCPLSFKTREIRDQFENNFRDLIEEAKEFI